MASAAGLGGVDHGPSAWRRLLRALNSPLRVRIFGMMLVAVGIGVFALWRLSADAAPESRDMAAQKYQAETFGTASWMSAQIATIHGSLQSADSYVAAGNDLRSLCDLMGSDARHPYQRLNVFTAGGNLRCSTVPDARDQPDVIRARPYFQSALATGDDQVGGPLLSAFSGRATLTFAHPVRNRGNIVGVVVGANDVSDLLQPVSSRLHTQRALIVGRDGGRYELGVGAAPDLPQPVLDMAARALSTVEGCPVTVLDGLAWTCASVGQAGLVLLVAHPERSVFAAYFDALDMQRYRVVGSIAVSIFAGFAIDFLFLRRIRRAYDNAGLAGLHVGDALNRDEVDDLSAWARGTQATLHQLQIELDTHEQRRLISERDLLTAIAETVEIRYPFLRNHGDRVGRYARQIGARLGVTGEDLELLAFAARVHDLGKIAIADAVYLKPGRLEPIETAQMQLHAARGGEIASRMRTVLPAVADAIRHHHERWDGAGYPDGLQGTEIPFWSRIISVADAYDAMTEDRPYRDRPRSHQEAIAILKDGAGSQWDSTAVHAFLEVVESGDVQPKSAPIPFRRAASDG